MSKQNTARDQVCSVTVMDTSDPDIYFDENGVSNYVHEFKSFRATLPDCETRDRRLTESIAAIKASSQGRPYDCVLGLSGGVDSSYLAWCAKEWGLRPLIVHFDNGWNSELAVKNIEEIVNNLGFDLETYVIDWASFRDLQKAYFRASVVDIEIPTDHLIFAALHKIAAKYGVKIILSGHNSATEWLLPKAWYFSKFDLRNLSDINRQHGTGTLAKLPKLGVWQQFWYHHVRRIRTFQPLQLIDYHKAAAKDLLINELGWSDYGGKHHESIFTRFYQGYVLPRKFGIDKRKAHLSNLILMNQMARDTALIELEQPTYDLKLQEADREYVAKKLGFSDDELETILSTPPRSHRDFATDERDRELYFQIARVWGRLRSLVGWKKRTKLFL